MQESGNFIIMGMAYDILVNLIAGAILAFLGIFLIIRRKNKVLIIDSILSRRTIKVPISKKKIFFKITLFPTL
jgi:hypothetical protein